MRNHGTSPHAEPMDYLHMAADILQFIEKLGLSKISLLGHSMYVYTAPLAPISTENCVSSWRRGGKAAMTLALDKNLPSGLLENLIVVDISPIKGKVSRTTISYIEAMRRIEALNLTGPNARKEADKLLVDVEKVVFSPQPRSFWSTQNC